MSTAATWLPEPRGKGTGAEAGTAARTKLAKRRISVLLSHNAESYPEYVITQAAPIGLSVYSSQHK